MNQQPQKPKVIREVPSEWDEIMTLVAKITHGQIVIKISDKKVQLVEYTIKRKPEDSKDSVEIVPLI